MRWLEQPVWKDIVKEVGRTREYAVIISPYLSEGAVRELLTAIRPAVVKVITKWSPIDIAVGANDVSIRELVLNTDGGEFFLCDHLHAKIIVSDWKRCVCGSANITNTGLGREGAYNYELVGIEEEIPDGVTRLVSHIELASWKPSESEAKMMEEKAEQCMDALRTLDGLRNYTVRSRGFKVERTTLEGEPQGTMIPSLPMSERPAEVFEVYRGEADEGRSQASEDIRHDLSLFDLEDGLTEAAFKRQICEWMHRQALIRELAEFVSEKRSFGAISEWLHSYLDERSEKRIWRKDVKEHLDILLGWLDYACSERYTMTDTEHSVLVQRSS